MVQHGLRETSVAEMQRGRGRMSTSYERRRDGGGKERRRKEKRDGRRELGN